jgi:signal transduction histidine kinase
MAAPSRDAEAETDLLARSVTHGLRQPLSLIVGYAELLARPDLPEPERARLLAELRVAAARLAGSLALLERAERAGTGASG